MLLTGAMDAHKEARRLAVNQSMCYAARDLQQKHVQGHKQQQGEVYLRRVYIAL